MTARSIAHRIATPARRSQTLLGWIMAVDAGFRQRTALSSLEPHLLEDIGLSASERDRLLAKPVWDAPASWRK